METHETRPCGGRVFLCASVPFEQCRPPKKLTLAITRPSTGLASCRMQTPGRWGCVRVDLAAFFRSRDPSAGSWPSVFTCCRNRRTTLPPFSPWRMPHSRETVEVARSLGAVVPDKESPWDQLLSLGRAWESDFVWMIPQGDTSWTLAGGVVCFPSSGRCREKKLGQQMRAIHTPVPGLNPALEKQIEDVLESHAARTALGSRERGLQPQMTQKNHLPSRPRRPPRCDSDTRRGLPPSGASAAQQAAKCGAILFGIRVEVVSLRHALQDPIACTRLRRLITTISPDAARDKGLAHARETILALMR